MQKETLNQGEKTVSGSSTVDSQSSILSSPSAVISRLFVHHVTCAESFPHAVRGLQAMSGFVLNAEAISQYRAAGVFM